MKFKDVKIGQGFKTLGGAIYIRVNPESYQDEYGETHLFNSLYLDEGHSHLYIFDDNEAVNLTTKCSNCRHYNKETLCIDKDIDIETFSCSLFEEKEMINMKVIDEKSLKHLGAPEDCISWFLQKHGSLPVSKIEDIEDGKRKRYLIDEYVHTKYNKEGHSISFDDNKGYSWVAKLDVRGNKLSKVNSKGFSIYSTFDERDNRLTLENSDGCSWVATYDERRNMLTYADSSDVSWVATYDRNNKRTSFKTIEDKS